MELGRIKSKIPEYINKYKYLILALIVGIALMLLPGKVSETNGITKENNVSDPVIDEAIMLQNILKNVAGAGRVEVMLTKATESEYIYQTDDDAATTDSGGNSNKKTVIISDGSKSEKGLIKRINAPLYRGAVVVCDGGDDPGVRLAIVDAVSKVTGLNSNQIAVLKME